MVESWNALPFTNHMIKWNQSWQKFQNQSIECLCFVAYSLCSLFLAHLDQWSMWGIVIIFCLLSIDYSHSIYFSLTTGSNGTKLDRNVSWAVVNGSDDFCSNWGFNVVARVNIAIWLTDISNLFLSITIYLLHGRNVSIMTRFELKDGHHSRIRFLRRALLKGEQMIFFSNIKLD